MMKDAAYWIDQLALEKHPEGGYFKEVYRSTEQIVQSVLPSRFSGNRSFSTSIYFLLQGEQVSAFHRIVQDELWHFYTGSSLLVHCLNEQGEHEILRLGSDVQQGDCFQGVVPAGQWFGAEVEDKNSFALVGCTVAPGFDFADLEMAKCSVLEDKYPQQADLIRRLSHLV